MDRQVKVFCLSVLLIMSILFCYSIISYQYKMMQCISNSLSLSVDIYEILILEVRQVK